MYQWRGILKLCIGASIFFNICYAQKNTATAYITSGDQIQLLQKQLLPLSQTQSMNATNRISIDTREKFQTVDGFGFTLTGGSALLIQQMPTKQRNALLQELFGKKDNSISISYLRVSVGASDLSESVFSYNDLAKGETDTLMQHFNLSRDTIHLVPLIKQIVAINPSIKFMATPWSPPTWMKTNNNSIGGSLIPQYYRAYARYLVKYIQAMKANGISIDALTIQNEPQHGGNNPSLLMTAEEQALFIKNHLGPIFSQHDIKTKIVIWDHNCDHPEFPIQILNDTDANRYIDGSAFHLYAGDISALSTVKKAHPNKNIYFTEQWTGSKGSFDGDLKWHIKNVLLGSLQNHSKIVLEWNLANNITYGPHTPGGCTECKGALTINGSTVTRNVAYYIIAHAAKFVPPGSVRIQSNSTQNIESVAFLTPEGSTILILLNNGTAEDSFYIGYNQQWANLTLKAGSVATIVFK
ncbi:MAG: glucosylceramidase [Chitinophaga sp.]|nr:glucosylceramidase [Chitinophaga sp.]